MLLWLNQFLSALYSPIFYNIFNRTDIRLDLPERNVAPKIVSKMYTKLYIIHSVDGVQLTILCTIFLSVLCATLSTTSTLLQDTIYLACIQRCLFDMFEVLI